MVASSTGAIFVKADVAVETDAERTIKTAIDAHGKINVLINNAGGPGPIGRLETLPLAGVDQVMAVHVRGPLAHIKHAAPTMSAQGSGCIVNIGSVAGHRAGYSSSVIYGTAKAAVIHLTRCAAMELGEDGVRVNSISPGGIATGIFAKSVGIAGAEADGTAERVKDKLSKLQAIPRAGLPDDIASAAIFLASDEASFVNGEDLVIDGGLIWGRRYSEVMAGGSAWKHLFD
jgi:NAD(P)-dependent dehydrogenase (short-subunit alcohol dehydrogenase family)